MKKLKKMLSCIMAILTLSSFNAIDTSAKVIDSNIETIYLSDTPNDDTTLGEEKEIVLNTGEVVTLPSWTTLIHDLDGNCYAYEIAYGSDEHNGYDFEYILIDDNRRIPGFPIFDVNKNYIGCKYDMDYIVHTNDTYTLPNGESITVNPIIDNEHAIATLSI